MPTLDRREPGVYVTIEDASYVAPSIEVGRVGYVVIAAPKGPHDRIVKVTSLDEFYQLFGKPNIKRYSQSAYVAIKFLQYSSNLLVTRVVPDDAYWANAYVQNVNDNKIKTESGGFTFTNGSDTVTTDDVGITEVKVGDYIFFENDAEPSAQKVTAIDTTAKSITLASPYGGTGGTGHAYILFKSDDNQFQFTNNSDKVIASQDGYAEINVGDWIYPTSEDKSHALQVISKEYDSEASQYVLNLSGKYTGSSVTSDIYKLLTFVQKSKKEITKEDSFDELDNTVPFYFYATGAGKYYNNIYIRGVRNTDLEKMYMDDDGNVLYKFMFMDIGIYYKDPVTGVETLLEGPWTVSLIPKTPDGSNVRDLSSGALLYIKHVINERSKYIRVVDAQGIDSLIYGDEAEDNRFKVMLQLSASAPRVTRYDTIKGGVATGGIKLDNGTDGTGQYDIVGNFNPTPEYLAKVKRAYNGTLESVDGSVEQMRESTYPWYLPDYILAGGWPANVEDGARQLSEDRQDCITLADTGGIKWKYSDDIDARLNDVPWNTWTAALYVQYRQINDPYSGEPIWITPVYHATERHLYVDGAYFIAEPVAGIEKGAIQEPIKLAYRANHTERGDLIDAELNPVIVEPDGKYILTQLTTWKRLSVLKRLHVAKFVAYLRKMIPPLLKDILQRKATQFWINQANIRVTNFLNRFLENPAIERYSVLKSFSVNVVFDDTTSELNVYIDITPIRAIEKINVFIIVH